MDIVNMSIKLNEKIEEKFKPLNWIDITLFKDGKGSISFTEDSESREDFFLKWLVLKNLLKVLVILLS